MQCFVHIEPVTIPATHNIVGLYHRNINLQARAINSKWDLHSYLSYRQVGLAIKNLLGVYSVHSALMHSRLLDSPRWWCKHCCIEPPSNIEIILDRSNSQYIGSSQFLDLKERGRTCIIRTRKRPKQTASRATSAALRRSDRTSQINDRLQAINLIEVITTRIQQGQHNFSVL